MTNQAAQTMPELKPCPFCGCTNNLHLRNTHSASFWVRCDDCSAMVSGKSFDGRHRSKRFSYDPEAPKCDPLSARTIGDLHPEYQKAAHSAINRWNRRAAAISQTAGVADGGLEAFTDYFVKNYPGPDTIIYDPKWHAPRIFRVAQRAIQAAAPAASGGECQADDDLPGLWERADLIGGMTEAEPNPPSGASVSERARGELSELERWKNRAIEAELSLIQTRDALDSLAAADREFDAAMAEQNPDTLKPAPPGMVQRRETARHQRAYALDRVSRKEEKENEQ